MSRKSDKPRLKPKIPSLGIWSFGLIVCAVFALSACGQGFQSAQGLCDLDCEQGAAGGGQSPGSPSGPGPGITHPDQDPFQGLNMKANINGGAFDSTRVVDFDPINESVIFILPVAVNPFVGEVEAEIPDIPGVYIRSYVSTDGTGYIAVSVPLRYVLRGIDFLDPAKLPNGQDLPDIPSGELPSHAFGLGRDVGVSLYFGIQVFAIYVQTPFNPFIRLRYPIFSEDQRKVVGYFVTVPAQGDHNGGFFLSYVLPPEISRRFDDLY